MQAVIVKMVKRWWWTAMSSGFDGR